MGAYLIFAALTNLTLNNLNLHLNKFRQKNSVLAQIKTNTDQKTTGKFKL